MQGYILKTQKVRDEDLIVTILTQNEQISLYRFFGVRLSILTVGYKIDFEVELTDNSATKRLRRVTELYANWQNDFEKLLYWQKYIQLLYQHLHGISDIDSFYFEHLEEVSNVLKRQNIKRSLINGYLKLLHFEGRLTEPKYCFLCDTPLGLDCTLTRAFLPTHFHCHYGRKIASQNIVLMMQTQKCLHLDTPVIEELWNLINEGL